MKNATIKEKQFVQYNLKKEIRLADMQTNVGIKMVLFQEKENLFYFPLTITPNMNVLENKLRYKEIVIIQ